MFDGKSPVAIEMMVQNMVVAVVVCVRVRMIYMGQLGTITCVLYFPCRHVRPVLLLCWSPFASSIGPRELAIELLWIHVHSCRPFLDQVMDHSIRDAFESAKNEVEIVKIANKKEIRLKNLVKLTRRANEYKLNVTCGTFRFSNKSAVWKISSSGNPYFFAKAWNRWTFSINWKLVPRSWIFFTDPGVILFANLHKTTPSFKMSS